MIQKCREQSNLTPKQLSRLLNITVHTYHAMEQGKISFRPDIIEMLSRIYQVQITDSGENQDGELKRIGEAFGTLSEEDRFFKAMENLTGTGSYQPSYRKVAKVKQNIWDKLYN